MSRRGAPDAPVRGGRLGISGVAHQNGTIRFGTDPASSALDVNCKAHELDNLYVTDASFFVSASAVNSTLTIIANALRVGEHLVKQRVPDQIAPVGPRNAVPASHGPWGVVPQPALAPFAATATGPRAPPRAKS
jgi:choline dehydrogenase-like flavoprotein